MSRWTEEEIDTAIRMLEVGGLWDDIANELNKSKESVRKKMNSMGYKKVEVWTKENTEKLIKLANENVSYKEIAKIFDRSEAAIGTKLNKLGFKKQGVGFSIDEITQMKIMMKKNYSNKKIANGLNRSIHTVTKKLREMGYKQEFPYLYEVGEVVNGVKVIKHTRGRQNQKAYIVQSIKHPKAENYTISESNLSNSKTCAYSGRSPKRTYPGNSLYSISKVRPYLIDIEQAKTLRPFYNKKEINFKCPHCSHLFKATPDNVVSRLNRDVEVCNICNSNTPYGQRSFGGYQTHFNLGLKSEKVLETLDNRRVDFVKFDENNNVKYFVEIQGEQHTNENHIWYEDAYEQDIAKRKWAKENNILMIEIDMRISSWEYFKEQINKCEYLPSINDEDEKAILKIMENNKRYPIKEIIELYVDSKMSCRVIGEKLGYSDTTISNLLQQNNVPLRSSTDYEQKKKDYNKFFPVKDIVKGYESGLSMYQLADKYNTCRTVISQILKNENVNMRNGSKKVRCVETGVIYNSITKAKQQTGITSISHCLNGKQNHAGGFTFEYVTVDNE